MRSVFSIKLCVLFILGSSVAKVSAQSALKPETASSSVNHRQTSVSGEESECIKKAEVRHRFLADMASRVKSSALMRAAATGQIQTVRALLRRGVNVNQKNAIGMTPLMLAAGAGHIEVVEALLAAGADPNAAGGVAHGPIFSVMTMAMISSNKNRVGLLDTLIAAGAKVNPPRGSPIAPLLFAIEACDKRMVQALLERDANVNWNRGAPLVAAVTNPHPEVEIVRLLLAAGADPNLPRVNVGGDEETLLSYLDHRMNLSRPDVGKKGDDAQKEMVQLLEKAGAKTPK